MSYLDRILNDGKDRDSWLLARHPVIGASDAAKFSKLASVPLYLADKLKTNTFHGNASTESGHRWEPMMLAWAGIPQNLALIHSPEDVGFGSTPDGIKTGSRLVMAECKAKHMKIVTGPTLGEWRQLAWQFITVPEAEETEFIWAEIVNDELRGNEPKNLTVKRGDPKIREVTDQIMPIARDLLPRLRAALQFEKEMNAA